VRLPSSGVSGLSTCLYLSENWVLTEKNKSRFQASERRFLRSTSRVTLTKKAIMQILEVNSLSDTISKCRDN
jgi:hypothetical protein